MAAQYQPSQLFERVGRWMRWVEVAAGSADSARLHTLATAAFAQAQRLEQTAKRTDRQAFVSWLRDGSTPDGLRLAAPTRRAFRWTRGALGWVPSPIGNSTLEDALH